MGCWWKTTSGWPPENWHGTWSWWFAKRNLLFQTSSTSTFWFYKVGAPDPVIHGVMGPLWMAENKWRTGVYRGYSPYKWSYGPLFTTARGPPCMLNFRACTGHGETATGRLMIKRKKMYESVKTTIKTTGCLVFTSGVRWSQWRIIMILTHPTTNVIRGKVNSWLIRVAINQPTSWSINKN